MEGVASYMNADKIKIWGIGSTTKKLQKQRLWTYIYMHRENQIIDESRSMPLHFLLAR